MGRVAQWVLVCLAVLASVVQAAEPPRPVSAGVVVLPVHGPIGPAVSDFVVRGLHSAAQAGSPAVILELDTPGGLDSSMRIIIKAILSSPVPVIVYVAPSGARAASAGTYILYASHVAVMAPATNVGAATPIAIGPGMMPGGERRPEGEDGEGEAATGGSEAAMERKLINDAVAYLRALAEFRGRAVDWAEDAVREGASLSAEEAAKRGVIDLMASDIEELLVKLDGRAVEVAGRMLTLQTSEWYSVRVALDWRSQVLAVITNPNVAYMLLLLGVYGLLFELYSPGAIIPGVVGVISLLLALYALQLLPVNYAGIALILVGIGLIVTELVTPTLGVLGVGGAVAFVVGSVILIDTDVEGYAISLPVVITMAVVATVMLVPTVWLAVRQRARPVVTGKEEMIGAIAQATESFAESGWVRAHGEMWMARSSQPIANGQQLRIISIDGLTLVVEPFE